MTPPDALRPGDRPVRRRRPGVPVLTAAAARGGLGQPARGHAARHRAGGGPARGRAVRRHGRADPGRPAAGPVRGRGHGRRRTASASAGCPTGKGILGLLVAEPTPLRLDDLARAPGVHRLSRRGTRRCARSSASRSGSARRCSATSTSPRSAPAVRSPPADAEVAQALAAVAGMAIENARLAERAETRRRWGQAATEMATALLSGADPDDVLRAVSTQVSALTNADMAGVLSPSVDDDGLHDDRGRRGHARRRLRGRPAAPDRHLPRRRSTRPASPGSSRTSAPCRSSAGARPRSSSSPPTFGPGMIAPLGNTPGRGLLAVLRSSGREPFSPDELDLLAAFAAQASVVLELARPSSGSAGCRSRPTGTASPATCTTTSSSASSPRRCPWTGSAGPGAEQPEAAGALCRSVDELDGTIAPRSARRSSSCTRTEDARARGRAPPARRGGPLGHRGPRPAAGPAHPQRAVEDLPPDLVLDLVAVVRELVTNVVRHAARRPADGGRRRRRTR